MALRGFQWVICARLRDLVHRKQTFYANPGVWKTDPFSDPFAVGSPNGTPSVISNEVRDLKRSFTKGLPLGIDRDNEIVLLFSTPFFDLLLPSYRGANIISFLEIDQLIYVISCCKSRNFLVFALIDSPLKIAGYAYVHDLVVLVRQ